MTRAMSYIDSPASTSAITYKWQVASYNASNGTGLILNELTICNRYFSRTSVLIFIF